MDILKFLLPPEEKVFYKLFGEAVTNAKDAATKLRELFENGGSVDIDQTKLAKIKKLKKRSNEIQKQTLQKLNDTFVTPIEPEDIQNIASMLNKITKRIAKVASTARVYRLGSITDQMIEQADLLVSATSELVFVIEQFQKSGNADKITASNLRIKEIETAGDDVLDRAMAELYSGKFEVLDVLKLRDIYKDLESALDGCFAVSDKVVNIVLKQS